MKKLYISIFCLLFAKQILAQTTVILNPSADNTIYSDLTGNSNGAGENFTAGTTLGSNIRRGMIRFDLSLIPAGVTIISAGLTLVMNKSNSGASNVSLHRLNQAWGEGASNAGNLGDGNGAVAQSGDATWLCSFANGAGGCTTSWNTAGGDFQSTASASASVDGLGAYTWNSNTQMVADVQYWFNSSANNFGWIIRGDETAVGSAKRFSSRTNSIVGDRPTLTVTYSSLVPVSLSFFNAQETKQGNLLRWQTTQEINNAFFQIEYSNDGIQFKNLGRINGRGNSSIATDYQFMHYDYEVGKNYYRLVQSDFNGRLTYSQIIIMSNSKQPVALLISPNPVRESINLKTTSFNGLQYRVVDITGRPVMTGILTGTIIPLSGKLQAGNYLLRIYKNDGSAVSGKFIKL